MIPIRLNDRQKLGLVTLGALVFAVVFAGFCPLLTTDTCCRSAPMAEAFAEGDWVRAFHPRFGVGFSVVAGTLCLLTGLDGYRACSIVAAIAWALTVIPLYRLSQRVFDEVSAWFAVALYLIAPMFFLWSLMGLRESFKVLGLLTMADAVFGCRDGGWRNFAEAVAGLALLVYFKVDAIAYGLLLLGVYMYVDRFRRRSWLLLFSMVFLLQPCCVLIHNWTGMWLPTPQYAQIWTKLIQ